MAAEAGSAAAGAAPALEQPRALDGPADVEPAQKVAKAAASKPAKPAKAAKGTKGSKGKDSKDSKGGKRAGEATEGPSVAAHPRAVSQVARAKGWGGLIGFALGGYLSLPTNTLVGAGVRAIVAGSVCYLVAWALAVFVWRQLVVIEIKRRQQDLLMAQSAAQLDPTGLPGAQHPVEAARTGTAS